MPCSAYGYMFSRASPIGRAVGSDGAGGGGGGAGDPGGL